MSETSEKPPRTRETAAMLRAMAPRRVAGRMVFRTVEGPVPEGAIGSFREAEGLSVIMPAGPDVAKGAAWAQITLDVHSALEGIGLTAAVASALASRGIACNVVAAHHHDHVFVPERRAEEAVAVLEALAAG